MEYESLPQLWSNASFLEKFLIVGGLCFVEVLLLLCLFYIIKRLLS